jgi:hypothetical protein
METFIDSKQLVHEKLLHRLAESDNSASVAA